MPLSIEPFDSKKHDRNAFDCGVQELNDYIKTEVLEDLNRRACKCWVLIHSDHPKEIGGFYTLSPISIRSLEVPPSESLSKRKDLPRYPEMGGYLLGRMAVSKEHRGKRYGELLLFDAFHRVVNAQVPGVLMVTDPKERTDPQERDARDFYLKYGFRELKSGNRLFIPVFQIAARLGG